jgi:hypothetical protein
MSKLQSSDNHEADTAFPKFLKQAGAPEQTTRKPVQAMDYDTIHRVHPDLGYAPLKRGTVVRYAGISVIVETLWEQHPALGAL